MKVFETTAALLVFAAPLLVLAVLAPSVELVRASVVVVPSTVAPTIQSGIAFGADTVLVGNGAPTNEALTVDRPLTLLAAAGASPRCASIFFDQALWPSASWAYGIVRGFAVDGATSFRMGDNPNRDFWQAMESCDLRGAVTSSGGLPYGGRIALNDCTISADVHLLHANVDLMRCTVTGAGARVSATVDGTCRVDSCLFLDAPLYAVWTGEGTGDNRVMRNRIQGAQTGIIVGVSGNNRVEENHVSNCGTGITNSGVGFFLAIRLNVVRDCLGDGIVAARAAYENTVVGCGGNGITAARGDHNLVANCGGIGIAIPAGNQNFCNLLWMNGADARDPYIRANTFADPLLCADGESVAANSPAITGSCGQIGALGVGCSTRELLAVNDGARPRLAVRMTKSGLALVSMAHGSTGRLEAFDVSGRRVASAEVREGPTRLALREGMYFLRLTRGAESVSAKVAVVE